MEEWRIRQLSGQPQDKTGKSAETAGCATFAELLDSVRRALKKKRRQARDARLQDVLLAIVILDRRSQRFLQFVAEQPEVLASIVHGSTSESSGLVVRGVVLGAVSFDRFPPSPVWTLVVSHPDTSFDTIGSDISTIRVPRSNHHGNDRAHGDKCDEQLENDHDVFYATVTRVSPISAVDQTARDAEDD